MKVKTFLALFVITIIVGLVCSIVYSTFQSDTDTIVETFSETIDVISVRQHPSNDNLLIVVHEYYDPECGCYEEVTINVNPLGCQCEFDSLRIPVTIRISGLKENNIYHLTQMWIVE